MKNKVTGTILVLLIILFAAGAVTITIGCFLIGVVLIALGVIGASLGYREIPSNPPKKGIITLWGKPWTKTIGGKEYNLPPVSGTVFVANYFPFNIGLIELEWEAKDKDINFEVLTWDKVNLSGTISLKAAIEPTEAIDFISAGKWDNIWAIIEETVEQTIQETITECNATADQIQLTMRLAAHGNRTIVEIIKDRVHAKIDAMGCGIDVSTIAISRLESSDKYKEAQESKQRQILERRGDEALHDTILGNARKMLDTLRSTGDRTTTLRDCIAAVQKNMALARGKVYAIEGAGNADVLLNVDDKDGGGGDQGGKKQKKGKGGK